MHETEPSSSLLLRSRWASLRCIPLHVLLWAHPFLFLIHCCLIVSSASAFCLGIYGWWLPTSLSSRSRPTAPVPLRPTRNPRQQALKQTKALLNHSFSIVFPPTLYSTVCLSISTTLPRLAISTRPCTCTTAKTFAPWNINLVKSHFVTVKYTHVRYAHFILLKKFLV